MGVPERVGGRIEAAAVVTSKSMMGRWVERRKGEGNQKKRIIVSFKKN